MIVLNPAWIDRDRYIDFLNRSFPGFWDRRSHDWYLAREFNGRASDLLVCADGERIVAGVSLSYRVVRAGSAAPVDVCIASAGATLASERRNGHYARLMRVAIARARQRGCAAMLGFVTRGNASGRGLSRMGARLIPSFHLTSADRPRTAHSDLRRSWVRTELGPVARLLENRRTRGAERERERDCTVRFDYHRAQDWERQFILRPHAVTAMRRGHDCHALLESVGDTDRLQYLSCPAAKEPASIAALAAQSERAGRRFFSYTLDPLAAAAAHRAGLVIRHGYLVVTPTGAHDEEFGLLTRSPWRVHSGDRL